MGCSYYTNRGHSACRSTSSVSKTLEIFSKPSFTHVQKHTNINHCFIQYPCSVDTKIFMQKSMVLYLQPPLESNNLKSHTPAPRKPCIHTDEMSHLQYRHHMYCQGPWEEEAWRRECSYVELGKRNQEDSGKERCHWWIRPRGTTEHNYHGNSCPSFRQAMRKLKVRKEESWTGSWRNLWDARDRLSQNH